MADEHPSVPAETGAEMDYPEHERTYSMFLSLSKWLVVFCVALLVAMAFGFFANGGLFGGTVLFVILLIMGYFLL